MLRTCLTSSLGILSAEGLIWNGKHNIANQIVINKMRERHLSPKNTCDLYFDPC